MIDIPAAVAFNQVQEKADKLTNEHQAWLVEFFQRVNNLTIDGKAGNLQTIPELEKYIRGRKAAGTYKARGTGYYPTPSATGSDENRMEGGPLDRRDTPLRTLQGFLAGKDSYVSCAMDVDAFPYGTKLKIPELEAKYGRPIEFRVVDTGNAFKGKGTTRIDICTASKKDSLDSIINGPLTLIVGG